MIRRLLLALAVGGVSGCVTFGSVESFRAGALDRAAFELKCPKEQIEVTQLPNATVGVTGCDKKLVYVEVSGQGWVLNSDERPAN